MLPPFDSDWRIPPLDALNSKSMLTWILARLTGHRLEMASTQDNQQLLNFVRLTDSALRQYEVGRALLAEYAENGSQGVLSPYFRAVDSFETCVTTAHRAVLAGVYVKRTGYLDFDLPSKKARGKLEDVRNGIEHIDGRLSHRARSGHPPQPHWLFPAPDRLVIDRAHITWEQLAATLTSLHDGVRTLVTPPDW